MKNADAHKPLDAALAGRAALEADRVRLMALHRKKVGMVQREAEAKHEEALKANHLLEENDFYDDMLMRIEFADDASDPCNGERIDPFGTFAPTFAFR